MYSWVRNHGIKIHILPQWRSRNHYSSFYRMYKVSQRRSRLPTKNGSENSIQSRGTLGQLMKEKMKRSSLRKKEVVYRIPCQDCKTRYIRESKKIIKRRITEHKYAVENIDRKNGIAVHVWDMGHWPDWEAAEVLEVKSQDVSRTVLEAIWIRNTPHVCNLDCGRAISEPWTTLA